MEREMYEGKKAFLGGRLPLGWGPCWRDLLFVTPLYVILALIFTFPLILNFSTYLIGDLESDIWKHVWGMWWTRLHLVELGTLPLNTHLLNAPYGGALFFIDPLNALISVPLQYFWDMRIVYNLMVLFNIVLANVGAFCLTRYLCSNRYAAFVGGVIYGFSAFMMAYINSGVTEAINIGWIPLFLLFFIRMLQRNSRADAVRSAVFFACATMGSFYYGAFCVLMGTFYYVYFVGHLYRSKVRAAIKSVKERLAWPWPRTLRCWGLVVLSGTIYLYFTGLGLQPFQGESYIWGLSCWGFLSLLLSYCARTRSFASLSLGKRLPLYTSGLVLVSYSAFWAFSTDVSEGDWPLFLCLTAAILLLIAAKKNLAQLQDEDFDAIWAGELLKTWREHFWGLSVLGMLSVPLWRHCYPEAGIAAFTYLFWTALGALLVFLSILEELRSKVRGLYCAEEENVSDREVLRRALSKWWNLQRGKALARRVVVTPCIFAVVAGSLIAGPTIAFNKTINAEGSLVFRKRVAHSVDIHLSRNFRNVSNLRDYFWASKSNTNRTYTVDKLTRVSYAGWVALVLAGFSLSVRRRQRNFWVVICLVFMMFSLGPFLYVTPDICVDEPSFIYMAFFRFFPAFAQIAIPYRFVTMVMMALAVLSSLTLSSWYRTWNKQQVLLFTATLSLAILFDVAVFSAAPYPIPLSESKMPAYCTELAQDRDDVGLIDYPIQRFKGELLPGEYFYYQMEHRKPIPNRVEGTIPLFVFQNAFTNYLFVLEHAQQDIPPRTDAVLQEGLEDLARFHFRYLVIHNNLLRASARERLHVLLRYYLGEPRHYPQGVDIYIVPPYAELLAKKKSLATKLSNS